ncbi:MAG: HemK/PrmC family methyltransferase [Candidatus Korobacteraceae bacterium]
MQLKQALASAVERLDAADVGSPRMNAEVLLMFVLGADRAYLYAHPERDLTPEQTARYEEALAQRATGMPSQYITGHQEFWGLDFVVSPAVLIPRPETEHLVEAVLELARGIQRPKLVDVGTGSGCVALALAHQLPDAEVYAVDLSAEALEIARANAVRLQLDKRVRFVRCNVLEPAVDQNLSVIPSEDFSPSPVILSEDFSPSRRTPTLAPSFLCDFDFVVGNPPYVALSEADKVQQSVQKFEPRMAVFAGENGLEVIGPLVEQAHAALKPGGWLAMEIGYSMRDDVVNLLSPTMWDDIRVVPDLQGIPRVVAARRL